MVAIDGMAPHMTVTHGLDWLRALKREVTETVEPVTTTVLRPLLSERKSDLILFVHYLKLPYMFDSTPKWSRRGWIRAVCDKITVDKQSMFLNLLKNAGMWSEILVKLKAIFIGTKTGFLHM